MPRFVWTTDYTDLIRPFEVRYNAPEAGALFAWAATSVEALHYLDDLDAAFDRSPKTVGNHNFDVVDVAHARWATATCVTAIDLCAAALGRAFCRNARKYEFNISYFDVSKQPKTAPNRACVPTATLTWVDAVLADAEYVQTKQARDSLTHSRVARHFTVGAKERYRLEVSVGPVRIPVRRIIVGALNVAVRHVPPLLALLPTI